MLKKTITILTGTLILTTTVTSFGNVNSNLLPKETHQAVKANMIEGINNLTSSQLPKKQVVGDITDDIFGQFAKAAAAATAQAIFGFDATDPKQILSNVFGIDVSDPVTDSLERIEQELAKIDDKIDHLDQATRSLIDKIDLRYMQDAWDAVSNGGSATNRALALAPREGGGNELANQMVYSGVVNALANNADLEKLGFKAFKGNIAEFINSLSSDDANKAAGIIFGNDKVTGIITPDSLKSISQFISGVTNKQFSQTGNLGTDLGSPLTDFLDYYLGAVYKIYANDYYTETNNNMKDFNSYLSASRYEMLNLQYQITMGLIIGNSIERSILDMQNNHKITSDDTKAKIIDLATLVKSRPNITDVQSLDKFYLKASDYVNKVFDDPSQDDKAGSGNVGRFYDRLSNDYILTKSGSDIANGSTKADPGKDFKSLLETSSSYQSYCKTIGVYDDALFAECLVASDGKNQTICSTDPDSCKKVIYGININNALSDSDAEYAQENYSNVTRKISFYLPANKPNHDAHLTATDGASDRGENTNLLEYSKSIAYESYSSRDYFEKLIDYTLPYSFYNDQNPSDIGDNVANGTPIGLFMGGANTFEGGADENDWIYSRDYHDGSTNLHDDGSFKDDAKAYYVNYLETPSGEPIYYTQYFDIYAHAYDTSYSGGASYHLETGVGCLSNDTRCNKGVEDNGPYIGSHSMPRAKIDIPDINDKATGFALLGRTIDYQMQVDDSSDMDTGRFHWSLLILNSQYFTSDLSNDPTNSVINRIGGGFRNKCYMNTSGEPTCYYQTYDKDKNTYDLVTTNLDADSVELLARAKNFTTSDRAYSLLDAVVSSKSAALNLAGNIWHNLGDFNPHYD
ncbi:hypothetical protein [Cysteiniphilum sp. JM-1]|uniref:hypothetical protein n=1 Tax=Cysteiniphilum sp. JM-1 TaxID=2610891 RepID=UPI00124882CB|nr:hypothetical protein [Cysteiniphilum sp. JM-1]